MMMATTPSTTFHGTRIERRAMETAFARNCTCVMDAHGVRTETCCGHDALVHEQRLVDGLLFARRIADRLEREEWTA